MQQPHLILQVQCKLLVITSLDFFIDAERYLQWALPAPLEWDFATAFFSSNLRPCSYLGFTVLAQGAIK